MVLVMQWGANNVNTAQNIKFNMEDLAEPVCDSGTFLTSYRLSEGIQLYTNWPTNTERDHNELCQREVCSVHV